jgi:hypothetical protein
VVRDVREDRHAKKTASPEDGRSKRTVPRRHVPSSYVQLPPCSSHRRTRGASAHPMTTRFPSWRPRGACSETLTIWASSAWKR